MGSGKVWLLRKVLDSFEGNEATEQLIGRLQEFKSNKQFIELIACNKVYRKALKPGDEPSACFKVCAEAVTAREHCNLHGLWIAQA